MKEFLTIVTFALTGTFFLVLLAVALWNEGCNQQAIPHPVKYAGRPVESIHKRNAELPMLNTDHGILVLPQ